ncbi:MAG: hypothetical protein DCC44_10100 [Acidobacteria bacterium]|nr:hypothetical protein [Pyrinomonadaceae bacterium]RIJ90876.1 MAG: hypothetical protein DCC44_10100 [Acidobacteriota bacterium]
MGTDNIDALCSLFLSLSDPTRLRLIRLLANDERPVGYLAEHLGESQPKVSRHLAFLRDHDVVATRREGKHIYYRINERFEGLGAILSVIFRGDSMPHTLPTEEIHPNQHIRISAYVEDDDLPVFLL